MLANIVSVILMICCIVIAYAVYDMIVTEIRLKKESKYLTIDISDCRMAVLREEATYEEIGAKPSIQWIIRFHKGDHKDQMVVVSEEELAEEHKQVPLRDQTTWKKIKEN